MSIVGGKEIYEKISPLIEQQFPEYIREEGPKFVAFVKAYYEFMETSGQAVREARKLYDTLDIDRTEDDYVEYFHRNFMDNIPRSVLADKRLLAKHIREFYRARGSQESCRFLFRALFDEEIEFYYPEEDILRASDGRWVRETVIRGIPESGNTMLLSGKQVTGSTSGATARISQILRISAAGLQLFDMTAENVIGEFDENELVSDEFGNSLRVFSAVGSIFEVDIIDGGAFHFSGDQIRLNGVNGGTAFGEVSRTTDISAVTFRILSGGSGYRIPSTTITISGGEPITAAQIEIKNLSSLTNVVVLSDLISPAANVALNSSPFGVGKSTFSSSDINTPLETALKFESVPTGSINTISLLYPGSGYTGQLPTVVIRDSEVAAQNISDVVFGGVLGNNAIVIAERVPGTIISISVTSSDASFLKNDSIVVTNLTRPSVDVLDTSLDESGNGPDYTRGLLRKNFYDASVTGKILGTFTLPGRYLDTKGFLSWNNRLQDNDFYQAFSYVISSRKLIRDYKKTLDLLTHPAGYKMFAFMRTETTVTTHEEFSVDVQKMLTEAGDFLRNEDGNNLMPDLVKQMDSSITLYENDPPPGFGSSFKITTAAMTNLESFDSPGWWDNGTLKVPSGSEPGSNLMIIMPDFSKLSLLVEGEGTIFLEDSGRLLHDDDGALIVEPAEPVGGELIHENGDPFIQDADPLNIPVLFANGLYTISTIPSNSTLTLKSAIEFDDAALRLRTEEDEVISTEKEEPIILDPEGAHFTNANGVFYYFKSRVGTI